MDLNNIATIRIEGYIVKARLCILKEAKNNFRVTSSLVFYLPYDIRKSWDLKCSLLR